MPQLYRRIHGIFINTSLVSSRILHPPARSFVSTRVEPLTMLKVPDIFDLHNEPDLRKLVDKIKFHSSKKFFSSHVKLYKDVVLRLVFAKKFSWIEELLEDQKQYMSSFPDNEGFIRAIISLYGDAGMFDHARKLFDEMPELNCQRTVKSFTSLLDACMKSDRTEQVVELFREIPLKLSISPTVISYTILLRAYSKMGSQDSMMATLNEMEEKGIQPDSVTYAILLDWLYKNGKVSGASDVWETMKSKSIVPCINCYNSKIAFLVSEKRMEEAVNVCYGFEDLRLNPDNFTFSFIIKGFVEERNLVMVKAWYRKMKKNVNSAGNRQICELLITFAIEMGDMEFVKLVCREAIARRSLLGEATLQSALDGLVKECKVKEAYMILAAFKRFACGVYTCKVKKLSEL